MTDLDLFECTVMANEHCVMSDNVESNKCTLPLMQALQKADLHPIQLICQFGK